MKYARISSYAILAKVKRDFGINTSGWVGDALEWIGEVLQEVGHKDALVFDYAEIDIDNNRGDLPCNFYSIIGVEYQNTRLRNRSSIRPAYKTALRRSDGQFDSIFQTVDLTTHSTEVQRIRSLNYNESEYYELTSYLETSFSCGTVILYFSAIPVDDNNFPLVPDLQELKNALAFYVLKMWLANGNTHPVFKYEDAEARYEQNLRKTRGKLKTPSVDEREKFTAMWTSVVTRIDAYSNFNEGLQNPTSIDGV